MVDGFACGSSGGGLGVVVSGIGFPVVSCWCRWSCLDIVMIAVGSAWGAARFMFRV